MSQSFDIPCTDRPANTIRLSVYKPTGRPAYVSVIEGRVSTNNSGGWSSFETQLFGDDRTLNVPLNGNNTAKNRTKALAVALDKLKELGWIAPDATLPE